MEANWLKQKNAENWICSNKTLARFMLKRRKSTELHRYARKVLKMSSLQITKRLNVACGYGIVMITGNPPGHYLELTALGKELYEKVLLDAKERRRIR